MQAVRNSIGYEDHKMTTEAETPWRRQRMPNRQPPGPLERRLQWLLFAPLAGCIVALLVWTAVAHAEVPPLPNCSSSSLKISLCLSAQAIATLTARRTPTPTRVSPTPTRVPPTPTRLPPTPTRVPLPTSTPLIGNFEFCDSYDYYNRAPVPCVTPTPNLYAPTCTRTATGMFCTNQATLNAQATHTAVAKIPTATVTPRRK